MQARPRLTQRLLGVLQELMELAGPAFAQLRELALGLSWNLALRDLVLEARLVATGVSKTLLRCLSDQDASVQVPPPFTLTLAAAASPNPSASLYLRSPRAIAVVAVCELSV